MTNGVCGQHARCETIEQLAAQRPGPVHGAGFRGLIRPEPAPGPVHQGARASAEVRPTRPSSSPHIVYVDRSGPACPIFGWPAKTRLDNSKITRDKFWDGHLDEDGVWHQPTFKQKTWTPPADGLMRPWGEFPGAGRMNRENELQWLIATSSYDLSGLSRDKHVPHAGECAHESELATTLATLRENAIEAISLNADQPEGDDAIEIEGTEPPVDMDIREERDAMRYGVAYDRPLPTTLRQIQTERDAAKSGRSIKFSVLKHRRTGEAFLSPWAGWRIPPYTNERGQYVRGIPIRFDDSNPDWVEASDEKRAYMENFLRQGFEHLDAHAGDVPLDEILEIRAERKAREAFYGRFWQRSLLSIRANRVLDHAIRTQDPVPEVLGEPNTPSLEDEADEIWSHVSSPHHACYEDEHGEFIHTECLDWGEFPIEPNCWCGKSHYELDPSIRIPVMRPDWEQPDKAEVIHWMTVDEYREFRSERPAFLGGLLEDQTRDVHDPALYGSGVIYKPWHPGEKPMPHHLTVAIFRLRALRIAWLKAGKGATK